MIQAEVHAIQVSFRQIDNALENVHGSIQRIKSLAVPQISDQRLRNNEVHDLSNEFMRIHRAVSGARSELTKNGIALMKIITQAPEYR